MRAFALSLRFQDAAGGRWHRWEKQIDTAQLPPRVTDACYLIFFHCTSEIGLQGILRTDMITPGPSTACYGRYSHGFGFQAWDGKMLPDDDSGVWNLNETARLFAKARGSSKFASGCIIEMHVVGVHGGRKRSSEIGDATRPGLILSQAGCHSIETVYAINEADTRGVRALWIFLDWPWAR
jgi:hypothetical protein